ncbi:MAG: polysaccharide biosynthesis/export family protein, partial [Candidatus Sulfotelmatobacter sp.]
MTKTGSRFWRTLVAASACLLISGGLWAQAASGGAAKVSSATPAAPSGDAPTQAKPHDNSFVIGNDDVLAINVWKEPDISRSIPVRSDGKIS